ncbi:hypothetical protein HMPREF1550_00383 [Actinomyces sp. oral taxon 877 str. F0543]|nr:hypothetical protein HMPREF1550_00383 [Actinomyces sp. oral taxon 877 str. F0543]
MQPRRTGARHGLNAGDSNAMALVPVAQNADSIKKRRSCNGK